MTFPRVDRREVMARVAAARERFEAWRARPLALDMTRGKPCPEQLDLASELFTVLGPDDYRAADGTDCRNYGALTGLPEAKALFAGMLGVEPGQVMVGGNSSLTLMHDVFARALSHGVPGGDGPWRAAPAKVLCPVPGYDRHFSVCEHFGVEMIPVDSGERGPDLDSIARLAGDDPGVKAVWIVPRYGNPTGVTLGPESAAALARVRAAAPDFRVLWDDAYAVHHLDDDPAAPAGILAACHSAGCPDRPLLFTSMSKVTFAGAGVSAVAGSDANLEWLARHWEKSTIGHDKLNQLRHVRFFKGFEGVRTHMRRHAAILRPKFETVERVLADRLGPTGLARWTRPRGGYFVSLDTIDGCASDVVQMAAEVGVRLTPAGATFPYRRDPSDRNIRIAPTFPSVTEVEQATEVLATCIVCVGASRLAGD